MEKIKYTVAIASGKGGVGKSTIAVNLALALVKEGRKTGLLDADIYGPSIPLMLDTANEKPKVIKTEVGTKIVPVAKYGLKIMSIGFLADHDQAVIWRGPMAASALKQFITDVMWDELDYLIFDMPPGTGDIQLTLTQTIPLTGAVIVTTPQEISIIDARKGAKMFQKVNVEVLGIIENMSYYLLPDNRREYIFGKGGGKKLADEMKIPFLGEIEINTVIREDCDRGKPIVIGHPDNNISGEFREIALTIEETLKKLTPPKQKNPVIEV